MSTVHLPGSDLPSIAAAESDRAVAALVLGPKWEVMTRHAGIIFAGTVLVPVPPVDRPTAGRTGGSPLRFRVDRAIAGVETGEILTVREWAGSADRALRGGQHILIFLYPPSRLGLTSPVGGARGQIALDATGKGVAENLTHLNPRIPRVGPGGMLVGGGRSHDASVSVSQLERAIRSARGE